MYLHPCQNISVGTYFRYQNCERNVRIRHTSRLPVVTTDIKSKAVDTIGIGECDVGSPGIYSVGVGIANHVVGHDILV